MVCFVELRMLVKIMSYKSNSNPSEPSRSEVYKTTSNDSRPPAGSVFGAAWTIAIKNPSMTLAVFLIQLPLTYALSQMPDDKLIKYSFNYVLWYGWLISGFVTFGVYRCALAWARNGQSGSFARVFSEGAPFWGRNFRLSWLYFVSQAVLFFGSLLPSLLMIWMVEVWLGYESIVGLCVLLLSIIVSLVCFVLAVLLAIRMALSTAWLADGDFGNRTSAISALRESLAITKGRKLGDLYGTLWISTLVYVLSLLLRFTVYFALGEGSEYDVSYEISALADILLSLPAAFVSVLSTCMFALLYLRFITPTNYATKQ